tara:strand:+ start:7724 stop:7894 length:171 start_codon:yes stop_codon:yes gene_type:complete
MNENLEDKTVIIIIISTLLLVFILIFTVIPSNKLNQPEIEWKDNSMPTYNETNINI